MAIRRPLVNLAGTLSELPAGDSVFAGDPLGQLPFYVASGANNDIPLTYDYKIPFYKASAAFSPIPLASSITPLAESLGGTGGSAGVLGTKNHIINAGFRFAQRGTTFSATGYTLDRWYITLTGHTATTTQQAFTIGQTDVPGEPTNFIRTVIDSNTGGSSAVCNYQHRIPGVRTLAGRTATLSFWAKADASKYLGVSFVQNFGGGVTVYPIGATRFSLTTSWQKFTLTVDIPSVAGYTPTGTLESLRCNFFMSAGSSSDAQSASTGLQTGTFDLAQVQLEEGAYATAFEYRTWAAENLMCKHFYHRWDADSSSATFVGQGYCHNTTDAYVLVQVPAVMRVLPVLGYNTVTVQTPGGSVAVTGLTLQGVQDKNCGGYHVLATTAGTFTAGDGARLRLALGAGGYVIFDAEI